eukprot:TRINITY_DN22756_c0_g1_i1.p1 TRINITY_DN22756_c0_g1~~TRINITY_DN22756_c0_g1_i1.p1  ORF type:complete len:120 (-),score=8.30 TRINITY_DN22756_c0_g1_i1:235-594(-)
MCKGELNCWRKMLQNSTHFLSEFGKRSRIGTLGQSVSIVRSLNYLPSIDFDAREMTQRLLDQNLAMRRNRKAERGEFKMVLDMACKAENSTPRVTVSGDFITRAACSSSDSRIRAITPV